MHPGRVAIAHAWMVPCWTILAIGCKSEAPTGVGGIFQCELVIAMAIEPPSTYLNIGDTLTLRWSVLSPDCVDPTDTLAANRRWFVTQNVGVVDVSTQTGHVTALRPGWTSVALAGEAQREAELYVLEPAGADSVFTNVRNRLRDSVTVVLRGADGAVFRSPTIAAGGWACWVTPLSDTLRYSAVAYTQTGTDSVPVLPGADQTFWLKYDHAFVATLLPPPGPVMVVGPVSPDPGGCSPQIGVSGVPDTLRYQATYFVPVSDTASYGFENFSPTASVTQATAATAGTATLTIRDANGMLIYSHDLAADGTFPTGMGSGINWTIQILLTGFKGTVSFSVIAN